MAEQKRRGRSAGEAIKDAGISLGKGVIGAGEAVVGLGDLLSGGRLGNAMQRGLGYDPEAAKRFLSGYYSPAQQEANRRVDEAKGVWDTTKAMVNNPSTLVHAGIEAAPTMLMGTGIGGKVLPKAGKFVESITAYGQKAPINPINLAAGIGEGLVNAGATAEDLRQKGVYNNQTALVLGGLGGAVTGRVGNNVMSKITKGKMPDLDTVLAQNAGKLPTIGGMAGGMASEGTVENYLQTGIEKASTPTARLLNEAAEQGPRRIQAREKKELQYAINAGMLGR